MTAIARTLLFVPGDRPERFDKACAAGADAVIIDLEDAVAPAAKSRARDAIADWLVAGPERAVWLRLNAAGSPWFDDDVALARQAGVAGVMLPKAERASDVAALAGMAVIALIARGMADLDAVAAAPGVTRLAFGSIDFQADVGIPGDGDALLAFPSRPKAAGRGRRMAPVCRKELQRRLHQSLACQEADIDQGPEMAPMSSST